MTLTKQISEQTSEALAFVVARSAGPIVSQRTVPASCGDEIDRVVQQISPPAAREIVDAVFQNLLALLECLDLIESRLRQVDEADETFALFQAIHDEARRLVDFIRTNALNNPAINEQLVDTLDGITFALSHDLQRVFEANPRGPLSENTSHVVVGKLYRAHDVLTNCLQQSTITLAMVFDSELVGARLFNNSDMRYRQSLQLYQDLNDLIELVETSEHNRAAPACVNLSAGIEKFRNESLECLMYSDWPQFESFCERIAVTPSESAEFGSALHQFRCYLETLLGQVRMRAVLANVFPIQFGEGDNRLSATSFDDHGARPSSEIDLEHELQNGEIPWNPLALAG
jgi:hypothetical protein